MKSIINIVLIAIIFLLGYLLINSIKEPIVFGEAKSKRKDAVVDKLKQIRTAQETYRVITGKFANNFDSLVYVLQNDSIPTIKLVEDPEDPTNKDKFKKIITYSPAIDSIRNMGISSLDSLSFVPFGNGAKFSVKADTLTYQKTLVGVVEVGTTWKSFMGQFADIRYSKYDAGYDPNAIIKFGDMTKPNIAGNWER